MAAPRLALASLTAALVALPAAAFAATPGRYAGTTGQKTPVSVNVNRAGTKVSAFRISYRLACGRGRTIQASFTYGNLAIRRNRFGGSGTVSHRLRSGRTATQRIWFSGRFESSRRVAGRWSAKLTTRGGTVCTVQRLGWTATRR